MSLRNPCGRCLVRPTCDEKCEKMKNYYNLFCEGIILIFAFIIFLTSIFIITQFYKFLPFHGASIITCAALLGGYYLCLKEVIDDDKEFKKLKLYQKILLIGFGPWLYSAAAIYGVLDYHDIIDKFVYRYNYRVHPYIRQKIEMEKAKKC